MISMEASDLRDLLRATVQPQVPIPPATDADRTARLQALLHQVENIALERGQEITRLKAALTKADKRAIDLFNDLGHREMRILDLQCRVAELEAAARPAGATPPPPFPTIDHKDRHHAR